jgi:hypothetical protein
VIISAINEEKSMISGTLRGVILAGYKIIYTIGREYVIARKHPDIEPDVNGC